MNANSVAGLSMLLSLWLLLPIAGLVLTSAILSFLGLVRGPAAHRVLLCVWWLAAICAVMATLQPRTGLNPYLDTPSPAFGFADAALIVSLLLCIVLPGIFVLRGIAIRRRTQ